MNGVNLNRFQFESDLTWMSFFQNSKGRTYARYGGRDDSGPESHLTKASLLHTMKAVLKLHQANAVQAISRFEPHPDDVVVPESLPTMKKMIGKREESCIHCHDVKLARLQHLRNEGRLKKQMVFTYPPPSNLGIRLNKVQQNVVDAVEPNSIAAKSGVKKGDEIVSSDEQRILTYADFTRVLELAPEQGELNLQVRRSDQPQSSTRNLKLMVVEGWKRTKDPSWRSSLGAVGPTGGFWGQKANAKQRQQVQAGPDDLAFRVNFIWGTWTKQAGIKHGDIIVSIDGKTHDMNARQIHAHLQLNRDWGDTITIELVRKGRRKKIEMTLPKSPAS